MKIWGIVFAVCGVFVLLNADFDSAFVCFGLAVLLIFLWYRKNKKAAPISPEQIVQFAQWPEKLQDEVLAYHYENVKLYTPPRYEKNRPRIKAGTELDVMPEPENPYDNRAVKFSYNGKTIGYVNRGRLQDMFNDWFTYGHPFIVRFLEYDSPESVAVNIAFYRGKEKKQSVSAEDE